MILLFGKELLEGVEGDLLCRLVDLADLLYEPLAVDSSYLVENDVASAVQDVDGNTRRVRRRAR